MIRKKTGLVCFEKDVAIKNESPSAQHREGFVIFSEPDRKISGKCC